MKNILDPILRREIENVFSVLKNEKKLSDKKIASYCMVDTQTVRRWRVLSHAPEEANLDRLKALASGEIENSSPVLGNKFDTVSVSSADLAMIFKEILLLKTRLEVIESELRKRESSGDK